jgi:VanZ family protein
MNAQPGTTAARWVAWAMSVAIVVLTFVPPQLRPMLGIPHALEHFTAFLLLGGALAWAYPHRILGFVLLAVPSIAVLEWSQQFAPGRHARLSDFVINVVAVCVGIILAALAILLRWRASAPP